MTYQFSSLNLHFSDIFLNVREWLFSQFRLWSCPINPGRTPEFWTLETPTCVRNFLWPPSATPHTPTRSALWHDSFQSLRLSMPSFLQLLQVLLSPGSHNQNVICICIVIPESPATQFQILSPSSSLMGRAELGNNRLVSWPDRCTFLIFI